uniref:F-box domain-containing protein n=1 Tax=Pristionchus pacificus TaxID=54126 RepID=A0A8R1UH31_PRIPA
MAGRKRKAVAPACSDSRPSKRTKRKSADAKSASPEKNEEEDTPAIDFSDLPAHFLTEVANKLTYTDLASFRLTCKKALEAVDHSGRSRRALDIARLVSELWPETREEMHNFHLDSLMTVEKEMAKLDSWLDFDLINSIDFANINCLNQPQLETVFGDKPRGNVKKLNLVGIVIMPEVWTTLARLFPGVKNVRCTEDAAHFPADILREMRTTPNKNLAPHTLVEQRQLVEGGQLDKDRVVTLRCIKRLFPKAQCMFVD